MIYPGEPDWMLHDWEESIDADFWLADVRPPLDKAIASDPGLALTLLNEGADIDCIYRGRTFLECAAYYKRLSVLQHLLRRGVAVAPRNSEHATALYLACYPHMRLKVVTTTMTLPRNYWNTELILIRQNL